MGDLVVGVVMGSDSDLRVMFEAVKVLENFRVPHETRITSIHRGPKEAMEYAETAEERGIQVIIAGAGGAAHLAGVLAALTNLPVIGVPIESKALSGMDSLLSTVQMPAGVPVPTMAINGAENAALSVVRILARSDETLVEKLREHREGLRESVKEKDAKLVRIGPRAYLSQ